MSDTGKDIWSSPPLKSDKEAFQRWLAQTRGTALKAYFLGAVGSFLTACGLRQDSVAEYDLAVQATTAARMPNPLQVERELMDVPLSLRTTAVRLEMECMPNTDGSIDTSLSSGVIIEETANSIVLAYARHSSETGNVAGKIIRRVTLSQPQWESNPTATFEITPNPDKPGTYKIPYVTREEEGNPIALMFIDKPSPKMLTARGSLPQTELYEQEPKKGDRWNTLSFPEASAGVGFAYGELRFAKAVKNVGGFPLLWLCEGKGTAGHQSSGGPVFAPGGRINNGLFAGTIERIFDDQIAIAPAAFYFNQLIKP